MIGTKGFFTYGKYPLCQWYRFGISTLLIKIGKLGSQRFRFLCLRVGLFDINAQRNHQP